MNKTAYEIGYKYANLSKIPQFLKAIPEYLSSIGGSNVGQSIMANALMGGIGGAVGGSGGMTTGALQGSLLGGLSGLAPFPAHINLPMSMLFGYMSAPKKKKELTTMEKLKSKLNIK